jgi:hypothetical protein
MGLWSSEERAGLGIAPRISVGAQRPPRWTPIPPCRCCGPSARWRACTAPSSAAAWRCAAPAPCTLDGQPIRSCVTPLASVANARVTTIEGLQSKQAKAVQAAWIELQVPQCGYCQSGQIMSATALLEKKRRAERCGHRRRHERQHLPVRHVCAHPRRHSRRRAVGEGLKPMSETACTPGMHRGAFLKNAGALASRADHRLRT